MYTEHKSTISETNSQKILVISWTFDPVNDHLFINLSNGELICIFSNTTQTSVGNLLQVGMLLHSVQLFQDL